MAAGRRPNPCRGVGVLTTWLLGAALAFATGLSAGEGPPESPSEPSPGAPAAEESAVVSAEAADEIAKVLDALGSALVAGDARKVAALISPALGPETRGEIRKLARREFAAHTYEKFHFVHPPPADYEGTSAGRVQVYAEADYSYRNADGTTDGAVQSYPFTFMRHEGSWYIVRSDLFDQFTDVNIHALYGRILSVALALGVALSFWGWMLMDCVLRYRRASLTVAILLTFPLGAVVYFFTVFLRRDRTPATPAPHGPGSAP